MPDQFRRMVNFSLLDCIVIDVGKLSIASQYRGWMGMHSETLDPANQKVLTAKSSVLYPKAMLTSSSLYSSVVTLRSKRAPCLGQRPRYTTVSIAVAHLTQNQSLQLC